MYTLSGDAPASGTLWNAPEPSRRVRKSIAPAPGCRKHQDSAFVGWNLPPLGSSCRQDTYRAAPARARCSCCGRRDCRGAAGPALPRRNPPCTPGTPALCRLVPVSLAPLGAMRSSPCLPAAAPCFPAVPGAVERDKFRAQEQGSGTGCAPGTGAPHLGDDSVKAALSPRIIPRIGVQHPAPGKGMLGAGNS